MSWRLIRPQPGAVSFTVWFAAVGSILPPILAIAAAGFPYFSDRFDFRPDPVTGIVFFLLVVAGFLAWPRFIEVMEMFRMGQSPSDIAWITVSGALMNGLVWAVVGALAWYALYRRSWAWHFILGVLEVHWWRLISALLFPLPFLR